MLIAINFIIKIIYILANSVLNVSTLSFSDSVLI